MKLYKLSLIALLFTLLSCSSDDDNGGGILPQTHIDTYVLGEGFWNSETSSLTRFCGETKVIERDYFRTVNGGMDIGNTPADMLVYGGKYYITVTSGNELIVGSIYSGKVIEKIDFGADKDNNKIQPRNMVSKDGKVYISTYYAGVQVLDTLDYSRKTIALSDIGSENIVLKDSRLYVANAGHDGAGKTISVVDIETQKEVDVINVPINPNKLVFDNAQNLYLVSWGNFNDIPSAIYSVNVAEKSYEPIKYKDTDDILNAGKVVVAGDYIFVLQNNFKDQYYIARYDINSKEIITVGTYSADDNFQPYDLSYSEDSKTLFILSTTGEVMELDPASLTKKITWNSGCTHPVKMNFVKSYNTII